MKPTPLALLPLLRHILFGLGVYLLPLTTLTILASLSLRILQDPGVDSRLHSANPVNDEKNLVVHGDDVAVVVVCVAQNHVATLLNML